MHPEPLHLAAAGWTLTIGPYALFLSLAVLATIVASTALARWRGVAWKDLAVLLPALLVAALVGGRLLNTLTNSSAATDGAAAFALAPRNFSLYGGVLLALAVGYAVCRLRHLDLFRLADALAPAAGLGIAIYRIGCYLRGCCFGEVTDLPWGVTFPLLSPAHLHQLDATGDFLSVAPVHPTQLYELVAALLLGAAALWLLVQRAPAGAAALVFAIGFTAFRWGNDALRAPSGTSAVPPWFSNAFYAALLVGFTVLAVARHQTGARRRRVSP